MDDLSLRHKIMLLPGVATTGFVLVLLVTWFLGEQNRGLLTRIEQGHAPALELSRNLAETFTNIQRDLQDGVASVDGESVEGTRALRDRFLGLLLDGSQNSVFDQRDLENLRVEFSEYHDRALDLSLRLIDGESGDELYADLEGMTESRKRIEQALHAQSDSRARALTEAFEATQRNRRASLLVVMGITAFWAVVLAAASLWMSRFISRRVQSLTAAAEGIASEDMSELAAEAKLMAGGDLTRKMRACRRAVTVTSRDEMGQMGASFNLMLGKLDDFTEAFNLMSAGLRDIVVNVQSAADGVAEGSGAVAFATSAAARDNETTANQLETITATLHEMTTSIQSVARSAHSQAHLAKQNLGSVGELLQSVQKIAREADTLVGLAKQADEAVTGGKDVMRSASNGMQDIRSAIGASAELILELGEMTEGIAKIVSVIDDVAEQTNLLALNAAIEAARAGEHGLGFAVVADEVRALAESSARSTRDISELVRAIRGQTELAVGRMKESTAIVERGIERTDELGRTFERIDVTVSEVARRSHEIGDATARQSAGTHRIEETTARLAELTQEISAAAEQHSTGAEQVVDAIEGIRGMAQSNVDKVSTLAASAEELSRQAELLKELTSRFYAGTEGDSGTERAIHGGMAVAGPRSQRVPLALRH